MNVPIACNPDSGGAVCRLLPPPRLLPPRGGLTLIEILMTIFVLAIGLLGVAALLPVGTFQMRQGQIAQQSAEVGSRALDTIEASGINHPGRWLTYLFQGPPVNAYLPFPFDAVVDIDPASDRAEYVRIACPVSAYDPANRKLTMPASTVAQFSSVDTDLAGCLVEFVRGQSKLLTQQGNIATSSPPDITLNLPGFTLNPVLNDIFVIKRYAPFAIDPLYVADPAHSVDPDGAPINPAPAFVPNIDPGLPGIMPRLTLSNGLGSPMNLSAAEAVFESTDELQFTPGREGDSASSSEDESKLPEQLAWQSSGGGAAAKRQFQGEYSWLATFVPVEAAGNYRDGRTYTVSVAVFYKRPLQLPSSASERTLTLAHDGGSTFSISGTTFEDTFEDNDGDGTFDQEAGDESYIKSGLWGLVTYTDTGGTDRARWYRLGSVGKPADTTDNPVKARLIGPDFPTGAESPLEPPQITFYEGLVAVFERTMRVPELPVGEAP